MTDPYYARIIELVRQNFKPASDGGQSPQVSELENRLTRPLPEEATYSPPTVEVTEKLVPGDAHAVPVRIYRSEATESGRPLVVWCHGGGFLGGDLDMPEADSVGREIAARAGAVVVSVDYRLCLNGVHYPAPSDDVITVIEWAVEQADTFGVDRTRIIVGGASAGACLAASASIRVRDSDIQPLAATILAYPVVHPVVPQPSPELASKLSELSPGLALAPEIMDPVMENYLGCDAADAPGHATPGIATDLTGLSPTLIFNCEYDGLRASGEAYAAQLRSAGVEVVSHLVEGVSHGHLNRPGLPEAQHSLDQIVDWIRTHRATSPAPK